MVLFGHPRRAEGRSKKPGAGGGGGKYLVMWWAFCPSPVGIKLMGLLKSGRAWLPLPFPRLRQPCPCQRRKKTLRDLAALQELLFAKLVSLVIAASASPCPSLTELNCKMNSHLFYLMHNFDQFRRN